jgi:hypothetical protein
MVLGLVRTIERTINMVLGLVRTMERTINMVLGLVRTIVLLFLLDRIPY